MDTSRPAYDNNGAPITIGPDGTAYAGVFNGIVAVRDTPWRAARFLIRSPPPDGNG
ncbi:hypothetical protein [Streptomyces sp. 1268]|uniref:hypothetical protein n=1 Tax=Streptomyces sp. 1268 TaxID=3231942 RepID=UPI0038D46D8B